MSVQENKSPLALESSPTSAVSGLQPAAVNLKPNEVTVVIEQVANKTISEVTQSFEKTISAPISAPSTFFEIPKPSPLSSQPEAASAKVEAISAPTQSVIETKPISVVIPSSSSTPEITAAKTVEVVQKTLPTPPSSNPVNPTSTPTNVPSTPALVPSVIPEVKTPALVSLKNVSKSWPKSLAISGGLGLAFFAVVLLLMKTYNSFGDHRSTASTTTPPLTPLSTRQYILAAVLGTSISLLSFFLLERKNFHRQVK